MNSKTLKKIVTHSGNFHTDEVFACATLSILNKGNIEIARSRDGELLVARPDGSVLPSTAWEA